MLFNYTTMKIASECIVKIEVAAKVDYIKIIAIARKQIGEL